MKKKNRKPVDDNMRSEYDFSKLKGGVWGKYAKSQKKELDSRLRGNDRCKSIVKSEKS